MSNRIVYIIPTMDQGGAEKQVCLLAAQLPKSSFDVHVVLLTRGGPREAMLKAANVPYTLVGKRTKFDPTAYFRLKKVLKELRPDLVHTYLFAANAYGRAAAKACGVRCIVASERCVDPWKTMRHATIDRHQAKYTAAITTNSSGVKDFYVARGIREDLFRIIPNGIEPYSGNIASREEVSKRLGIEPQRKWVLAVGRLWPQKQYRDLVWAGEMINTLREDDTTLVIVGDGPQRAELQRYRDAISSEHKIKFVGERKDVAEIMPAFNAFWLASAYEGQSNALMEAMRAGLPCIVSDIPGNRDLIEQDVTGVLVRLNDVSDYVRQTQHCWTHPEWCERLTKAAQTRIASDFTIERMVQQHAMLYESLLGQ